MTGTGLLATVDKRLLLTCQAALAPSPSLLKGKKKVAALAGACACVHARGHVCVCTLEPPLPALRKNVNSTCRAVTLTDEMES